MSDPLVEIRDELRKNNRLLLGILRAVRDDEADACPLCGETAPDQIVPSSAMGEHGKMTCLSCCGSFVREETNDA